MLKSYNFPSVYEATNQELANVAENILDGIKINLDDTDYIVGNLALVEGYYRKSDLGWGAGGGVFAGQRGFITHRGHGSKRQAEAGKEFAAKARGGSEHKGGHVGSA